MPKPTPHAAVAPLTFRGAPGSPYTRKMLALLRYRRIPYRLLIGRHDTDDGWPKPKVALLPTFYLPNERGELEAVVDSTPLIRRIEREFTDRYVVPDDPVVRFIDELVEDYADEWLTKAMFHYRWRYTADIERAGEILPRWTGVTASEEQMQKSKRFIQRRQIERLYVVGSNDTTAPVIEASYRRFLGIFARLLERQPFLLGARPAAADFAAYGQLTQLAHFDPTPTALALEIAPRVFAWVDVVDDLSGLDVDAAAWTPRGEVRERLGELLNEIGRTYAPFMVANAAALAHGAAEVALTIDGKPWTQQPFPYQGRCTAWLRESYSALTAADRRAVDAILSGTGCESLFAP
jgi:glutathione S-transferase